MPHPMRGFYSTALLAETGSNGGWIVVHSLPLFLVPVEGVESRDLNCGRPLYKRRRLTNAAPSTRDLNIGDGRPSLFRIRFDILCIGKS